MLKPRSDPATKRDRSAIGSGCVPGYDARHDFRKLAPHVPRRHPPIEVTVEPKFLPERSLVDHGEYFWSYTFVILNSGDETVQLRTRHWIITDATGRKQEVRGEGVVGEQPVLAPATLRIHLPACRCRPPSGFMTGRYQMVTESGERFEIDVPTFSLDSPDNKRVLN